jgi:hypothetical protein
MSVRVMARVWAHSGQSGSGLLLMLALADGSDDDGLCLVDMNDLAHKARLTVEQTRGELNRLVSRAAIKKIDNTGGEGMDYLQIIEAQRVN